MTDLEIYPWHEAHLDRIVRLRASDKLPHALLFSGPENLGKRDFAMAIAAFMMCRSPHTSGRCGACDNCHLFDAGTHPDFRLIAPQDSRLIKIEQIRDLIEWSNQTPQRGGARTVVIAPAEQMNVFSANALLKCLEEPGPNTLIILVTDLPGRLLPTIRSRCQHFAFTVPERALALAWLAGKVKGEVLGADVEGLLSIAGGAPLAVANDYTEAFLVRRRELATAIASLVQGENPLVAARALMGASPEEDLAVIYSVFADAMRLGLSGDKKMIKNKDIQDIIELVCKYIKGRALFTVVDAVARARQEARSSSNPNIQLLFESLAVDIAGYCSL
jgi:DNA polymerase-3 subunit delta'